MRKIDRKYYPFLFAGLMSFAMSVIMSAIITWTLCGFCEDFLFKWGNSFITGFAAAFPVAFFISPVVGKIVDAITK
ncbi:DUF2798 domain-containing protein [Methanoplanus sp. FWC-SCC4]|uniref:DUF2798 domain-containing protein n=1 Tax=Methanochimaera problematica TaxID=2609417 RepID=A0AA97FBV4_9EURY|nr:DUF2798 domain-containing protein [Methanoplanus sp. FWC-SCC4]WOF15349.1 DUF2798 domain-containing protein [Methanoplanus sp. FWC-SCC4]